MMPSSSRSLSASSPTLGMSRVISSGPSLVSRASISCFSMWIEVYLSSCTSRSLTRMASSKLPPSQLTVGDDHVLAQGQLAVVGAGASRPAPSPCVHDVALEDDRALVDAGALVGAVVLAQGVDAARAVLFLHDDRVAGDADHFAGVFGDDHLAGVDGRLVFHAGADDGRFGADQRHGLALHVGAHQGAVGVVVLQEGDQRGRDAHDLLGRDVHEAHLVGLGEFKGFAAARRRARVVEFADRVEADDAWAIAACSSSSAVRKTTSRVTKGLTRTLGDRRRWRRGRRRSFWPRSASITGVALVGNRPRRWPGR